MERYVTVNECETTRATLKSRIKWLSWLLVLGVGITTITAEEAWRARDGFDQINTKLSRQTGVSETQIQGIQRSLDRIDRKLEQQEAVLHRVLQHNLNDP